MTRAGKLESKKGHKVICDKCLVAKEYNDKWMMSTDYIIVCPECAKELARENRVLVSV